MSISSISPETPLFQHACPFATEPTLEGRLTRSSIQRRQNELSDTGCIVSTFRREAVLNSVADGSAEASTVKKVCQSIAANHAKSGLWNDDGTLNVPLLTELRRRCAMLKGRDQAAATPVLTRSIFQRFVNEQRALKYQGNLPYIIAFGNLTRLGCLPVPHTVVTDGSIDALFHAYPHSEKYNDEKTIAWHSVSRFYDPDNIAKLRED